MKLEFNTSIDCGTFECPVEVVAEVRGPMPSPEDIEIKSVHERGDTRSKWSALSITEAQEIWLKEIAIDEYNDWDKARNAPWMPSAEGRFP